MPVVRDRALPCAGSGDRLPALWHQFAARGALLVGALRLAEKHTRAWLALSGSQRMAPVGPARDQQARAMQTLAYLLAGRRTPEAGAEAQAWLQQAIELEPQEAAAWFNLGYLRQRAGQHAAAADDFRQALSLSPELDRAWYGLGLSLLALGQPAAALEALQANTRLQPHSPYGWAACARAQCLLGDADGARTTLEHLRSFEPRAARDLERELERELDREPQGNAERSADR